MIDFFGNPFGANLNTWLDNGLPVRRGGKNKGAERAALDALGGPEGFRTKHVTLHGGAEMTVRTKGNMPPQVTYTRREDWGGGAGPSWTGSAHFSHLIAHVSFNMELRPEANGYPQEDLSRQGTFFSLDNIVDVWSYDEAHQVYRLSDFVWYSNEKREVVLYPPRNVNLNVVGRFPATLQDGKVYIGSPWHGRIQRISPNAYLIANNIVTHPHAAGDVANSYHLLERDVRVLNLSGKPPSPTAGPRNYALLTGSESGNTQRYSFGYPYSVQLAYWPYIAADGTRFGLGIGTAGGASPNVEVWIEDSFTLKFYVSAVRTAPVEGNSTGERVQLGYFDVVAPGFPDFGSGSGYPTFALEFSPSGKKAAVIVVLHNAHPWYRHERFFWRGVGYVCAVAELTFHGGSMTQGFPTFQVAPVQGIINHTEHEGDSLGEWEDLRVHTEDLGSNATAEDKTDAWEDGDGAQWVRVTTTVTHHKNFGPEPPLDNVLRLHERVDRTVRVGYGADDTLNVLRLVTEVDHKESVDAGSGWSASPVISYETVYRNNVQKEFNILRTASGGATTSQGNDVRNYKSSIKVLRNGTEVFSLNETGSLTTPNVWGFGNTQITWETMTYLGDPPFGYWEEMRPDVPPSVRFTSTSQGNNPSSYSGTAVKVESKFGVHNLLGIVVLRYAGVPFSPSPVRTGVLVGIDGHVQEISVEQLHEAEFTVFTREPGGGGLSTLGSDTWCCYDPVEKQFTMTPFERFT
jgi:hypothetical protein